MAALQVEAMMTDSPITGSVMPNGTVLSRFFAGSSGLAVVCLLFVAVGALGVNDVMLYNPDSANYVIVGNSVAHGHGFVDSTMVVPNRHLVNAPLYTVLIAPVEMFFPMSLVAVKLWTLGWGLVAVVATFQLFRRLLDGSGAFLGTLLFAVSPLTLAFSCQPLSEAPFTALVIYILLALDRSSDSQENGKVNVILVSMALAACILLREAGVALIVAVAGFLLLRRRWKVALASVIVPMLFFALWYYRNEHLVGASAASGPGNLALTFQHFVTTPDESLAKELSLRVWTNLKLYGAQAGGGLLVGPFIPLIMYPSSFSETMSGWLISGMPLIIGSLSAAVLLGLYADVRASDTGKLRLSFLFIHILIISVYPVNDPRFLFPVFPLIILYIMKGWGMIAGRILRQAGGGRRLASVAVCCLLLAPVVTVDYDVLKSNYRHWTSPSDVYIKSRSSGLTVTHKTPWTALGEWVAGNVADDAAIATPVKDLALVIGERKVVPLDRGVELPEFERILYDQSVDYVLAPNGPGGVRYLEFAMNESRRFWFDLVFSVADLNVFRVHSRYADPPLTRFTPVVGDTTSASWLLREGRFELTRGHFEKASAQFARALAVEPANQELVYEAFLAACLGEDRNNARLYYDRLFGLSQALSLTNQARLQNDILENLGKARTALPEIRRALQVFSIASEYWNHGYPSKTIQLMKDVVQADSTYFVGLLWGWEYSLQWGDTAGANEYLRRLRAIDDTNRVVKTFKKIMADEDSLKRLSSPAARSEMHMAIAFSYLGIELNLDAVDEAMRAAGDDPNNARAYEFLGRMFEQKKARRAAARNYLRLLSIEPQNQLARSRLAQLGPL